MSKEVKPIVIKDSELGVEYTLEFNRESVSFAERKGFDITNSDKFLMTTLPDLFYYAFRMHHKNISREKTDKLFEELTPLPETFYERLYELYTTPYSSLVCGEDEPKNSHLMIEM